MGITVVNTEKAHTPYIVLEEKVWLSKDRTRAVPDGDPDAGFLIGTPGKRVPLDFARSIGLAPPAGDAEESEDEQTGDAGPDDAKLEDLTVAQLRVRLERRDLSTKGPKNTLIERLKKALEEEQGESEKGREPGSDKQKKDTQDK